MSFIVKKPVNVCLICDNELEDHSNSSLKCKKCELIINKTGFQSQDYDGVFWNRSDYSEFAGTDFSDKKVQDLVLLWKSWYEYTKDFLSGRILDVGSGTGISLVMFEKRNFAVTGIEPDKENCKKINSVLKKGKCHNGFLEDLSTTEKFDVIWLTHVLEHVDDPIKMLNRFTELLNKNGLIFIAVPDCESVSMLKHSLSNPFHLYHFSKNNLLQLCRKCGYEIIRADSVSEMNKTVRRGNKILRKLKLGIISDLLYPYYPFRLTKGKNGYEIRVILKKI